MRSFTLWRDVDETGISGTGVVAEGIEFSDGVVCLRWMSEWPSSVVHYERGIASVEAIHGHNGKTRIVFTDDRIAADVALVRTALAEVYKPEGVDIWMTAPNKLLNNATPMQFIIAGDTDRVLGVIDMLAGGAFV